MTTANLIAYIEGFGLKPVPHSFTSKIVNWTIVPAPNPALRAWRAFVQEKARQAMGDRSPFDEGAVSAEIILICKTPYGKKAGDLWSQNVRWDRERARAVREGPPVPDLDNLVKSTLDGLKGIVIADDVQVRSLDGSRMIYGPRAGFRVAIRRMGPAQ